MPAATGVRSKRPTSTGWPRAACGSRSSTTRPAAGRRGPAFSPATTPSRSTATSCPAEAAAPTGRRPAWARLLPELLRPLGYRSYHSGKWHVDGTPLEGGFDARLRLQRHRSSLHTGRQEARRRVCQHGRSGRRHAPTRRARGRLRGPPLLPVPVLYRAALPPASAAGGHRPLPHSLPGGLGRAPAGAMQADDRTGHGQLRALQARSRHLARLEPVEES